MLVLLLFAGLVGLVPARRDAEATLNDLSAIAGRHLRSRLDSDAELNPEEEFLRTNSRREDVVTLPSGLQYSIIKTGSGDAAQPGPQNPCVVHYSGALIDGTVFGT